MKVRHRDGMREKRGNIGRGGYEGKEGEIQFL